MPIISFAKRRNPSDGNCFFHLYQKQNPDPLFWRHIAANYVKAHWNSMDTLTSYFFNVVYDFNTQDQYIEYILNSSNWGSIFEARAIFNMTGIALMVYVFNDWYKPYVFTKEEQDTITQMIFGLFSYGHYDLLEASIDGQLMVTLDSHEIINAFMSSLHQD